MDKNYRWNHARTLCVAQLVGKPTVESSGKNVRLLHGLRETLIMGT